MSEDVPHVPLSRRGARWHVDVQPTREELEWLSRQPLGVWACLRCRRSWPNGTEPDQCPTDGTWLVRVRYRVRLPDDLGGQG